MTNRVVRRKATELRGKYSRVFRVPVADVVVEYTSKTDVRIYYRDPSNPSVPAPGYPPWTFGSQPRSRT